MKRLIFSFIYIFYPFCFWGQTAFSIEKFNEVISSIEKIKEHVEILQVWVNDDNIEESIKQDIIFYSQYSFLLNSHVDFKLEHFNKCIAEQYNKNNQYAAAASLTLANLYAMNNQFDLAIKHSKDIILHYNYLKEKDPYLMAYANCIIGHSYIGKHEFESAYEPLKESLNYFQPKDSLDNMYSLALTDLATIESNKVDFNSAYKYSKLATRLRGITFGEKSTAYAASAYILSASSLGLEKYDEAIRYGNVVLNYYKDNVINDSINRSQIEYVVGRSHFALNNIPKAYEHLNSAFNYFPLYIKTENIIYAKILNELGLVYRDLGNFSKALELVEESFLLKEKIIGDNNLEYAIGLFNMALCLSDNDRKHEAIEYGERANKLLYNLKHIPLYIRSIEELASYYFQNDKYSLAIEYGNKACELNKSQYGNSSNEYASSISDLAYYYHEYESVTKAIEIENKALQMHANNKNQDGIAISLSHFGRYYNKLEEYDKAIEYNKESSAIFKELKGDKDPAYISKLLDLSRCYNKLGDYSQAIYFAEQYASAIKQTNGETSSKYAIALDNLASCYNSIGNIEKEFLYQTKSLEIIDKYKNTNPIVYVAILGNMGRSLAYKGKAKQSLEITQHIIDFLKQNGINNTTVIINSIEYKVGLGFYEEAIENINNIVETVQPNTFSYAKLLYLKAYCLNSINKLKESIEINNKALSIVGKLLGDSHPYYIRLLELQTSNYLIVDNDSLFINNLQIENSSIRKYLEEQLCAFSETDRNVVYNIIRQFYDDVADYIFVTNYKKEIKDILYNGVLMTKGLLLDIQKSSMSAYKIVNDDYYHNSLLKLSTLKHKYNKSIESFNDDADSLLISIRNIEREILQDYRNHFKVDNYSFSWKDIQNSLSPNDVAVEFINYPYWELDTDSIIYGALVIRKDWQEPTFVALKKKSIIQYHHNNRKDSVMNISNNSPLAHYLSLPITSNNKNELYQCIWSNLVTNQLIKPGDNIYFSASGILHQIPIESLPIGDGKIMSDVYNMHRLSSTRELVKEKKEAKYTKAALYGGLNYDMTDNELLAENQTYSKNATEEYFVSRGLLEDSIRGYKWDNLSNTLQEVDYISDLMKKNQITTQTYKGNKGNEESFKALSGHEYNIIHLATHGFFYPDEEAKEKDYFKPMLLNDNYRMYNEVDMSMWRSGLVMSGGNRAWKGDTIPDTVEDGILKAQEIGDLDLRGADLVVLSACNTGQGEVTGEGVFGLQRAFKMAGAQTIVMSLTPVDDQTTMAMMNKFYTNLFSGQSKHDAFYNAQRYIRSIKPDPKYWMGWIMLD